MLIIRPRPESIGEGTRRLYTSDKLKKADPDLVARINLVTQELEDIARELAHRAGRKTNRHKKRRTDGPNESRDSTEHARSSSHMGVSHSLEVHDITPAGDHTSTPRPGHDPIPVIAGSSSSGILVPPNGTDGVTAVSSSKQPLMEQRLIEKAVRSLLFVISHP